MPDLESIEQVIGFPPNTGRSDHINMIENNAIRQTSVRAWIQKQGIPSGAARSATVKSLAIAYTNERYLKTWRNRLNPQFAMLDDSEELASEVKKEEPQALAASQQVSEQWLRDLYLQITKTVEQLTESKISNAKLQLDASAKEAIRQLSAASGEEAARKLLAEALPPRTIEIHNHILGTTTNVGLQHEKFPILLKALQAKDHRGFALNVWLTGPTGSGKTSAAENAAKALNLKFGSDGSLDADYKVLGFRDANGNVISTQFLDIYENGGIYVADEIDNWLPSALLSLNSALANGWVSSPRGLIARHKDCRVIACANTWGLGATSDYVGRTKLDAASLDRFHPKIDWPVDEKLERAIAEQMGGTLGLEWHNVILQSRAAAQRQGLKIIISPRATFNGIALQLAGFTSDETIPMTFGAGLSEDQRKAIGIDKPKKVDSGFDYRGNFATPEMLQAIRVKNFVIAAQLYIDKYGCSLVEAQEAIGFYSRRLAA